MSKAAGTEPAGEALQSLTVDAPGYAAYPGAPLGSVRFACKHDQIARPAARERLGPRLRDRIACCDRRDFCGGRHLDDKGAALAWAVEDFDVSALRPDRPSGDRQAQSQSRAVFARRSPNAVNTSVLPSGRKRLSQLRQEHRQSVFQFGSGRWWPRTRADFDPRFRDDLVPIGGHEFIQHWIPLGTATCPGPFWLLPRFGPRGSTRRSLPRDERGGCRCVRVVTCSCSQLQAS